MNNTHLKSLQAFTMLCTRVHPCSEFVTDMDRKVLRRRIESEGISFLCVTLPKLGKALERALELGEWQETPIGFKTDKRTGRPYLFANAFAAVFDEQNIVKDIDVKHVSTAVLTIRQLTLAHGKCDFGGVTPAQASAVWERFKANQTRIGNIDFHAVIGEEAFKNAAGLPVPLLRVLKTARKLVHEVCGHFDPASLVPVHGNGAAANRSLTPRRYDVGMHAYNAELDRVMPYSDYLFAGATHLSDQLQVLQNMHSAEEFYDKAAFVSKNFEDARGISIHHSTPMYFGQAIQRWFQGAMESSPYANEIDIKSQERNKVRAREGSRPYGNDATLDARDASDSIKWVFPYVLLPKQLAEACFATRSTGTKYGKESVRYECYAPMGSPTCFPVQTLFFWSVTKAVCMHYTGVKTNVSVYGDDIICDKRAFDAVIAALEKCGVQINRTKSFAKGLFRESCGGDYYGGYDVSIVRCKKPPVPTSTTEGKSYLSGIVPEKVLQESAFRYADLYSRLIRRYSISAFEPVWSKITNTIAGHLTTGLPEVYCDSEESAEAIAGSLALPTDGPTKLGDLAQKQWNKRLQKREVKLLSFRSDPIPIITRPQLCKELPERWVYVKSGWSLVLRKLTSMPSIECDNGRRYTPGHVGSPCSVSYGNSYVDEDCNVLSLRTVPLLGPITTFVAE